MTRSGTLAYYLAGWVIGCFVVSLLQWVGNALSGDFETASDLLTTYFFCLAFGAVAILLFSFLLRRAMHPLGTHYIGVWFASGAALGLILIAGLIHVQTRLISVQPGGFEAFLFGAVLKPADVLAGKNLWQAPVDGAVTGAVLCLVDRAFAGADKAAEPKRSPA
jgi:hypothetical protein